jgi:hypothetical protein
MNETNVLHQKYLDIINRLPAELPSNLEALRELASKVGSAVLFSKDLAEAIRIPKKADLDIHSWTEEQKSKIPGALLPDILTLSDRLFDYQDRFFNRLSAAYEEELIGIRSTLPKSSDKAREFRERVAGIIDNLDTDVLLAMGHRREDYFKRVVLSQVTTPMEIRRLARAFLNLEEHLAEVIIEEQRTDQILILYKKYQRVWSLPIVFPTSPAELRQWSSQVGAATAFADDVAEVLAITERIFSNIRHWANNQKNKIPRALFPGVLALSDHIEDRRKNFFDQLCAGYERESTSILFDLSKAPDDVEKFHAKVKRLKEDFGESVALAQGLKPGEVKPGPDSVPMDARRKVIHLRQEFSAIEAAMTVQVRYKEILRELHLQERFVDFLCERYEEGLTSCTADLLSGRRPSSELRQKVELLLEELDINVAAALDGDVDTSSWRNYWRLRKLMQDISSEGMDLEEQAERRREPVDSQPSNLLGPAAAKRQPDVRSVAGRAGQKRPTFVYQTNDLIRMPGLPGRLECFSLPDKIWSDQQMSGAQIVVDAPNALLLLPPVVNRPDMALSTTGSLAGLHVRLDYAQSAIALIIAGTAEIARCISRYVYIGTCRLHHLTGNGTGLLCINHLKPYKEDKPEHHPVVEAWDARVLCREIENVYDIRCAEIEYVECPPAPWPVSPVKGSKRYYINRTQLEPTAHEAAQDRFIRTMSRPERSNLPMRYILGRLLSQASRLDQVSASSKQGIHR